MLAGKRFIQKPAYAVLRQALHWFQMDTEKALFWYEATCKWLIQVLCLFYIKHITICKHYKLKNQVMQRFQIMYIEVYTHFFSWTRLGACVGHDGRVIVYKD
jgi:restriction endonuclease